ncbi:hypothetical protein BH09SUM1_BH09SUM1_28270 [soil metagenome]
MSSGVDSPTFSSTADWLTEPGAPGGLLAVEMVRGGHDGLIGGVIAQLLSGSLPPLYGMDCANVFDPHGVSNAAREAGLSSREALRHVFVTRAHTIYQAQSVLAKMLPPLTRREPRPYVGVWALDHLFFEETLRMSEREYVLREVLAGLTQLATAGLRIVITIQPPVDGHTWIPNLIIPACGEFRPLPPPSQKGDPHGTQLRYL